MTEAFENEHLVRVRAQVMCRDEGTGGWVTTEGGGLADVCVGKRLRPHVDNGDKTSPPAPLPHEYYIHGTRISDNMVVLECTIQKDFQYNKVMPTFHHWLTDGRRFGLTFQTAADARAFDKGVRTAVEELLTGLAGAWPSLHAYKEGNPSLKDDDEEQNIFECLNLPCSSRSSSETSNASRLRMTDAQTPILCPIALPTHHGEGVKYDAVYHHHGDEKAEEGDSDRCPYVHLLAIHDYSYPQVGSGSISSEKSVPTTKPPLLKQDSGSLKKGMGDQPPFIEKATAPSRFKCRHCEEFYIEGANRPGSCELAPDNFRECIDYVSCIKCARCMVYHCMTDSDGDHGMHPCSCHEQPNESCTKRWLGLTLLSILFPCLCLYPPLHCAHRAAKNAQIAGGMHSPQRDPQRRIREF